MRDLQVLVENKDALLLAEMGAWLHDMRKCSDEFIATKVGTGQNKSSQNGSKDKTDFLKLLGGYAKETIPLQEEVSLQELIERGRPKNVKKEQEPYLIRYLGRCHAAAHIEKEAEVHKKQKGNEKKEENNKKEAKDARISTPFGYEGDPLRGLTSKLKDLPFEKLERRKEFLIPLKDTFKTTLGDTRRPINEVDLWSWSSIVAALYKAALAGALLGHKPAPEDLRWRLLAVRLDTARVLGSADKIPVLLARKEWISKGLDAVQTLLEETYPIGNEVYRDENGSIFVIPDLEGLLEIKDSARGKYLNELISEALDYDGEITVSPVVSEHWWAQSPDRNPADDEVPPIGDLLKNDLYSPPDIKRVQEWWNSRNHRPQVCTVSWLRPEERRSGHARVSRYWAEKIGGRAEEWLNRRDTTIWIDEVADRNGRICLIAGRFDLSDWLAPDGHIRSLVVDHNLAEVTKTPSFARLRRIWETTRTFWEEVEADFLRPISVTEPRVVFSGVFTSKNGKNLEDSRAYEAVAGRTSFSVFYSSGKFFIIENLAWLARKITREEEGDPRELIREFLNDKNVTIREPDGGGREIGELRVGQIADDEKSYPAVIPIVSDPSTFMAIVPADCAVEIAGRVKKKYETEMGKVRSKLPLTLGLVFAGSRTPLAALMDAGRRMLDRKVRKDCWALADDVNLYGNNYLLRFTNGVTWQVPGKMGDNTTDDDWYLHLYVLGEPPENTHGFQHPTKPCVWLVHARDLKKGTSVVVFPSTFDFEFLDVSSRRWEVDYDGQGRRRQKMKSTRPYLLEELDKFETIWESLAGSLTSSQIWKVVRAIETKRLEWPEGKEDETLQGFIHDVLRNAHWRGGAHDGEHPMPEEVATLVEEAAVSGMLRDVTELYMQILKEKPKPMEKRV
ncbi:MAG: CRISPR-associated protein Csx11 [Candidatus Methanoculleus thermohydrogenotrophicum]|jgi:hypothetical protein